jgi:ribulose bisphosphate carboxylase small subunit
MPEMKMPHKTVRTSLTLDEQAQADVKYLVSRGFRVGLIIRRALAEKVQKIKYMEELNNVTAERPSKDMI